MRHFTDHRLSLNYTNIDTHDVSFHDGLYSPKCAMKKKIKENDASSENEKTSRSNKEKILKDLNNLKH